MKESIQAIPKRFLKDIKFFKIIANLLLDKIPNPKYIEKFLRRLNKVNFSIYLDKTLICNIVINLFLRGANLQFFV